MPTRGDGSGSVGDRMIVLRKSVLSDGLARPKLWLGDGTSKVAPSIFFQLYTIHFELAPGRNPAAIYCPVQNKTQVAYDRTLDEVKRMYPLVAPERALLDFESAAINLQCTDDDNRSYRNVCNMSFVSFSLAVIFIIRLFSTSRLKGEAPQKCFQSGLALAKTGPAKCVAQRGPTAFDLSTGHFTKTWQLAGHVDKMMYKTTGFTRFETKKKISECVVEIVTK